MNKRKNLLNTGNQKAAKRSVKSMWLTVLQNFPIFPFTRLKWLPLSLH